MIAFQRLASRALMSLLSATVATSAVQAQTTAPTAPAATASRSRTQTADYIVAIVNQELVTAGEVQQRIDRLREEAQRSKSKLPPDDELRHQVVDALIDERVQITNARDVGQRVDDVELERAVANVAAQNQLTPAQLRERLKKEGIDYVRFRNNVRDQLQVERVREREVQARITITDAEVDAVLDKQRAAAGSATEYNIAQILVTVPENASETLIAERRTKAEAALNRVRSSSPFEVVAREVSEDGNKARGGEIGMRPADRLPDIFVEAVRGLKPGEVAPTLLRSGAGFHVMKLIDKREGGAFSVTQTRARHILLRPSPQLSQEAAVRRLQEMKRQIQSGSRNFDQLARDNSEDGSAAQGGDLGWVSPGGFVPEFEEAMNALPINGLSEPVVSRFGVHLIQVIERRKMSLDLRQQREQARNILREQKFEEAYTAWARDLRARAYIEMREAPQ
ncbi:peptidylprolyl isomerase [Rhizobacter sp. OV335]|uniref:peptidylprolyl isomerase n=1 Tax=Rhizobacter sp. OV335 TaxID=1500264 RepID=UPI0009156750|nr:peptidylprolyl isomerase [Rhizobacter sp. OV335]SHM77306.1 periplasmic chaperone for outer membrane proteins SurA [Rhizobacter sp. OV335]